MWDVWAWPEVLCGCLCGVIVVLVLDFVVFGAFYIIPWVCAFFCTFFSFLVVIFGEIVVLFLLFSYCCIYAVLILTFAAPFGCGFFIVFAFWAGLYLSLVLCFFFISFPLLIGFFCRF